MGHCRQPLFCCANMQCSAIFVISLFIAIVVAPPPSSSKVYRTDYVYNKKTDAFYKLHIEQKNRLDAGKICELEGTSLMYPNKLDIVQLHGMLKQYPDIGNVVRVAEDGKEHESAEEPAIINLDVAEESRPSLMTSECDVVTRNGEIDSMPCYRLLPFICKVEANDAPYNRECDVYGTGYHIFPNVSSCYKIPHYPMTWNEAYSDCKAEGAHLVILNSVAEHEEVFRFMNSEPKVEGSQAWWFYFAGFRAAVPSPGEQRVFKTVFNETLQDAGFEVWADNEPNNAKTNENCGSLFRNDGKLNDLSCWDTYGYICEKEIAHH